MSYRSSLTVVECKARMKALDVGKARRLLEQNEVYVESCFLDEMEKAATGSIDEGLTTAMIDIPLHQCWWSGNHADAGQIASIASMISGKLSGYFVGEDGSLHGGFSIEDGRLTKCEITVTLTPATGR